jgi:hypothetical protein
MKNSIKAIVGLALLAAVSASAQTGTQQTNQFKVPFSFMVGNSTMPAAAYRVQFTPGNGLVKLYISAGAAPASVFTQTVPYDYRPDASRDVLSFQRYGDTWILKMVQVSGNEQEPVLTKSEKKVIAASKQEQVAGNAPAPQTAIVSIVASR